jgi:hypothetical protein
VHIGDVGLALVVDLDDAQARSWDRSVWKRWEQKRAH